MKRKCNRVLSWLLTLVMLLTSFEGISIPVLAGEGDPSVSVQAISVNGFDDVDGRDGATFENALSVTVSVNDAVDLSFRSAVVSENGVSENAAVSWNLVSANGVDAVVLPAGLKKSVSGNVFTISGNVTASVNYSYKLTASYTGAADKVIFFTIVAEDKADIPVSSNKVTVSANGFDSNGKDGSSPADALSVTVSVNEAVDLSFKGAVVSANGTVSAGAAVSWSLVSGNGVDAALLPAGLTDAASGNVFTISGNVTASANETYMLTASCAGADDKIIYFTIVAEGEAVIPDPVSPDKVSVSANGFDENGNDGSSSANALSVTVSVNEAVDLSFNAAVISGNGTVSADAVVSWNLVSGNGVDEAVLPAGLSAAVSGNVYTISGNVTASFNGVYILTASYDGASEAVVFFNIIAEETATPEPDPLSGNKIILSADGFADNSKGSTSANALSLTASLNEAIRVSFNASTVSGNGVVLSGNTVSFKLLNLAEGSDTLLTGLTAKANGNVYTVTGAVAASANGAYRLSASCDGFETAEIYFNITVKNPDPVKPEPPKEGIWIEGLEDSYAYTGAAVKPAITVVDYDRDVILVEKVDYTLKYRDNKKPGTATITVNGKGNYAGKSTLASFEILTPAEYTGIAADTLASSVKGIKIISKDRLIYDGSEKYPSIIEVKTKDVKITMTHEGDGVYSGSDTNKTVILTFSNNVNKGTATVAATGADGKSKKKSFKIAPAQLPADGYDVAEAVFAVKGATPAITGDFNGADIVSGRDFKASYNGNKAVGTATATLKGKGNFTGSATISFDIKALELDDDAVAVNAVPGKKINLKSIIVADGSGAKITKKNLLSVEVSPSGKLSAGDDITVTVTGDGTNIIGEAVITIKVGAAKKAKVKVEKGYTVEYTGSPIDLEALAENPFTTGKITIDGLDYGTDYIVATYLNNTKKGTMQVILQGVSEKFTGTAVAKVKIASKEVK